MSTVIQLKRSETANAIPAVGDIAVGELAVNLADGTLYSKKTDGSIIEIGGYNPEFFTIPTAIDLGDIAGVNPGIYDMGSL
jgi:hypothetical protein